MRFWMGPMMETLDKSQRGPRPGQLALPSGIHLPISKEEHSLVLATTLRKGMS